MEGFEIRFGMGHYETLVQSPRPMFGGGPLTGRDILHTHATYELQCVTAGSYIIHTDKERYEVSEGNIALIAPGVLHCGLTDLEKASDPERVDFRFTFTRQNGPTDDPSADSVPAAFSALEGVTVIQNDFDLLSQLREINRLLTSPETACLTQIRCRLCLLFIELARKLEPGRTEVRTIRDERLSVVEEFFNSFQTGQTMTAVLLADQLHLSVRQLNRLLNELYGMGFRQKLAEARMEAARYSLTYTTLSVPEIAALCGYAQEASFCHVFGRRFGCSPTQYRLRTGRTDSPK